MGLRSKSASSDVVTPQGVMKATVQPGSGETPGEGDQVLFHFTARSQDGSTYFSTLKEKGGSGCPRRAVLGHSKMIAGLKHGLLSMQPGEAALLRIQPEAHFGDKECELKCPENVPKNEELLIELQLLKVDEAVVVLSKKQDKTKKQKKQKDEAEEDDDDGADTGKGMEETGVEAAFVEKDERLVTKKVTSEGTGWEQPREPFELDIRLTASQEGAESPYFVGGIKKDALHVALGKQQLPSSLEQGLKSMLTGECSIIFTWEHARTETAGPSQSSFLVPLPPSAGPVLYKVELERIIQVRDVLGNGKVFKTRLVDGKGDFPVDCPLEDCVVRLHYKGMLPDSNNQVFVDTRVENEGTPVEFGTGEGMLPEALETSIRVMLPGEKALVTSTAAHAYDTFPRPEKVPEGARVQWEVELISFDKPTRWDDLSFREIMSEVEKIKELGNGLFKRSMFQLARAKYEKMIRELKNVHPQSEEETKEWNAVTMSLQLNVAACYHKLTEYKQAVEWADKVLESNPNHAKGLFRRGQAHMLAGDYEDAREDFKKMIAVDPSTTQEGQAMLAKLRKTQEEANLKQREQFKGLFDKKPGELAKDSTEPELASVVGPELASVVGTMGSSELLKRTEMPEPVEDPLAEFKKLGFQDLGYKPRDLPMRRPSSNMLSWLPTAIFCIALLVFGLALWKEVKSVGRQEQDL